MKKWMVLVCVLLLTGFWTGVGLADVTDTKRAAGIDYSRGSGGTGDCGDEVSF